MSRKDAEALIQAKEGKLCVRFFKRADGTVLTNNCPVGLRAIRRRLKLIGGGIAALFSFIACTVLVSLRREVNPNIKVVPSQDQKIDKSSTLQLYPTLQNNSQTDPYAALQEIPKTDVTMGDAVYEDPIELIYYSASERAALLAQDLNVLSNEKPCSNSSDAEMGGASHGVGDLQNYFDQFTRDPYNADKVDLWTLWRRSLNRLKSRH